MLRRFTRSIRYKFSAVPVRYWHFSGVEFTFWFATACAGFLTSFLQSQGMSSTQVGIISAANSAVAVVASPFWGMLSDKIRSIRTCLTVCIIIGGITWVCIPLVGNWVIAGTSFSMFFIPFSNFFRNPISMLKDSWVVGSANVQRLNYGAIRLWGSISYAIMSMILSLITPYIGMEWTFYLYGITLIPLLLLRWQLNVITMGDDEARAMGVNAPRIRLVIVLCSTLVTASAVSVSGMIGWVGLVIPHMLRRVVGSDYRWLLPASMLGGGIFLLLVDNVSRSLTTAGIPIGILTSFIGAPFFLWMITGRRDHYEH